MVLEVPALPVLLDLPTSPVPLELSASGGKRR